MVIDKVAVAKKAYEKQMLESEKSLVVDGVDTQVNLVKDPQALRTVENITEHRNRVRKSLLKLSAELVDRAYHHDDSKLESPEIQLLIGMDKEPFCKYGTPEYFEKMKRWSPFFLHHYSHNRHHPDYFKITEGIDPGVNGMTLVDLTEFCVDIISYCEHLNPEQARDIVSKQQQRFQLSDQIANILVNTLNTYFSVCSTTN